MDVTELRGLVSRVSLAASEDDAIAFDSRAWRAIVELVKFVAQLDDEPVPVEAAVAELKPYDATPTLAGILEVAEKFKYQVTFTPTHE